jgi:predicted Zn-dependent protease
VRVQQSWKLTLVQTTLLGAATSVAFGDFSTLLAGLPALLGQLGYSRELEREADGDAIGFMRANGASPPVMVTMFELMSRPASRDTASAPPARAASSPLESSIGLGIAFSSHPADDERIARFRAAAQR